MANGSPSPVGSYLSTQLLAGTCCPAASSTPLPPCAPWLLPFCALLLPCLLLPLSCPAACRAACPAGSLVLPLVSDQPVLHPACRQLLSCQAGSSALCTAWLCWTSWLVVLLFLPPAVPWLLVARAVPCVPPVRPSVEQSLLQLPPLCPSACNTVTAPVMERHVSLQAGTVKCRHACIGTHPHCCCSSCSSCSNLSIAVSNLLLFASVFCHVANHPSCVFIAPDIRVWQLLNDDRLHFAVNSCCLGRKMLTSM